MKVKIEMTVEVDPQAWVDNYGLNGDVRQAEVRDDVRRWTANTINEHPDGLLKVTSQVMGR